MPPDSPEEILVEAGLTPVDRPGETVTWQPGDPAAKRRYRRRGGVTAIQYTHDAYMVIVEAWLTGRRRGSRSIHGERCIFFDVGPFEHWLLPGDWLVQDDDGDIYTLTDCEFRAAYEVEEP